MSEPLLVMTNSAVPALEVHAPVMDKSGGLTQRLVSTSAASEPSFGLDRA